MEHPEQHEDAALANRAVKLPPFFARNPRSWFTSAEGAFRLRNIADEESRFYNCMHTLPETTVSLIANLVEADPLRQTRIQSYVASVPGARRTTPFSTACS